MLEDVLISAVFISLIIGVFMGLNMIKSYILTDEEQEKLAKFLDDFLKM